MISITLLNPNGFQTFDPLTIQTFRNSSLITIHNFTIFWHFTGSYLKISYRFAVSKHRRNRSTVSYTIKYKLLIQHVTNRANSPMGLRNLIIIMLHTPTNKGSLETTTCRYYA